MGTRNNADTEIGFLLADISRLLRRDFDRRVRDLGMTQAQWRRLTGENPSYYYPYGYAAKAASKVDELA